MHFARIGAALVDDARYLIVVNIGGVGEQMCGVFVRLGFQMAANVIGAVGVEIVPVSCVQSCVSEFVADRHLLPCIAEGFIQNDVFASKDIDKKAPYVIGKGKAYNRYAEVARELKRVACAVFVDKILDAERNVHRLHLFCGGDYR